MKRIAFFGAGGKMGIGICRKLDKAGFDLRCVEIAPEGVAALRKIGLDVLPKERAVADADAVVLAVPDEAVVDVAAEVVPSVASGALVQMLDPCAAHSGRLPERDDIGYVVTHPCHRSFLETEKRGQHVVAALYRGTEAHYELGVEIAKVMYGPTLDIHRLTVDQLVMLEPAISETVAGAALSIIKIGFDEVVRQGVPKKAAFDFLMGHIMATIRVLFGLRGFFSDGAYLTMENGIKRIVRDDWRETLSPESVREQVEAILDGTRLEGGGDNPITAEDLRQAVRDAQKAAGTTGLIQP